MMRVLVSAAGTSRAGGVPEPRRSVVRAHDRCGSGADRRRNHQPSWILVGDDAFFTLRARDVFTIDHLPAACRGPPRARPGAEPEPSGPASVRRVSAAGETRWWHRPGDRLGADQCNGRCRIAIVGHRAAAVVGRPPSRWSGAAWSMGSEVLFEPRQPHVPCCRSSLCDSRVGRLVRRSRQTAVGGSPRLRRPDASELRHPRSTPRSVGGRRCRVVLRGARRRDPSSWPASGDELSALGDRSSGVRRVLAAAAHRAVHLRRRRQPDMAGSARPRFKREDGWFRLRTRAVASVVSLPPWAPPIVREHVFASPGWRPPSLLLPPAHCSCWRPRLRRREAIRRHDRDASRAIVTAASCCCALSSALRTPTTRCSAPNRTCSDGPGLLPFMVLRSRWPSSADLQDCRSRSQACAALVVHRDPEPAHLEPGRWTEHAAVCTVRRACWTTRWACLRSDAPLLIDDPFKIFANPYAAAVLAELQDRNIPFVAKDETLVAARSRPSLRRSERERVAPEGDTTPTAPPGSRLAVRGSGLTTAEQRELADLQRQVGEHGGGSAASEQRRPPRLQRRFPCAPGSVAVGRFCRQAGVARLARVDHSGRPR